MDLSKLVDWIKLSPKYLLPISLVSGFLLFASERLLEVFGLSEFTSNFRPWIGIVFLLATSLLFVDFSFTIFAWLKTWRKNYLTQKNRNVLLRNLTPDEKDILLSYFLENTQTQYFAFQDGVVRGLELRGVLFQPSTVGGLGRWAFNIQPWAWDLLKVINKEIFSNDEIKAYRKSKESVLQRSRERAGYYFP